MYISDEAFKKSITFVSNAMVVIMLFATLISFFASQDVLFIVFLVLFLVFAVENISIRYLLRKCWY